MATGAKSPSRSPLTGQQPGGSCVPQGSVSLPCWTTPLLEVNSCFFLFLKVFCGSSFLEIMTACGLRGMLCGHRWQKHSRKGALRLGAASISQASQETGRLLFLADLPLLCETLPGCI